MMFTEKQRALLTLFKQKKLKRINVFEGSVRSGKTYISLVLFALWLLTMPRDKTYLLAAKTVTSLKRNCLDLLVSLFGERNFTYSITQKEGRLFGRKVLLEGASDVRAEGKIRGVTLSGAYLDELTLIPEDFFTMLLSRLSEPNAKLFATTNPDHPSHYVKKKYLDRKDELDLFVMRFLLDDNTFLPEEYVRGLKKEYTGVFYDRFILGKWVAAEGVIYRDFADNQGAFIKDTPPEIRVASVGVDFGGNRSATAFVLSGITENFDVYVLDEFYTKKTLSPRELEAEFVSFIEKNAEKYPIFDAFCDSAESTLILGLEQAAAAHGLPITVRRAIKGRILERIRFLNSMISKKRFFVLKGLEHIADAIANAVWDEKSLTDTRLDNGVQNVDSLDALEYSLEYYMKDLLAL